MKHSTKPSTGPNTAQFCELVVYFGDERGQALAEGLMAPRKKPLVQPAARWFLRQRPFEPELVDCLCRNADKLFICSESGVKQVTERGQVQSQSPITLLHLKLP